MIFLSFPYVRDGQSKAVEVGRGGRRKEEQPVQAQLGRADGSEGNEVWRSQKSGTLRDRRVGNDGLGRRFDWKERARPYPGADLGQTGAPLRPGGRRAAKSKVFGQYS